MNLKTIYILKGIIYAPFLIIWIFTSCDPALDEKIIINNNSSKSLIIVLEKAGYYNDTTEFYYQYEIMNPKHFIGNSLLIVECSVNSGSKLVLLDHGPLGTISIYKKEDGMSYLKEIIDTIYLKDYVLKKSIVNKDNWDLYIDSYNNGGGVSEFSFTINNEDIE
jgi:hypothetical protein